MYGWLCTRGPAYNHILGKLNTVEENESQYTKEEFTRVTKDLVNTLLEMDAQHVEEMNSNLKRVEN